MIYESAKRFSLKGLDICLFVDRLVAYAVSTRKSILFHCSSSSPRGIHMTLITLCGFPCSGKSGVADHLVRLIESTLPDHKVVIVPEPVSTPHHPTSFDPRADIYADSHRERELRGHHKSEVSSNPILQCE